MTEATVYGWRRLRDAQWALVRASAADEWQRRWFASHPEMMDRAKMAAHRLTFMDVAALIEALPRTGSYPDPPVPVRTAAADRRVRNRQRRQFARWLVRYRGYTERAARIEAHAYFARQRGCGWI